MQKTKYLIKFKKLEYTIDLINNECIFLNSPFNFNDPLDSYFVQLFGEIRGEVSISIQEYIDIGKQIYVFCGTTEENLTNMLMWSHYGNFHKGIALKYIIPEDLKGVLKNVDYDQCHHEEFMKAINHGNLLNLPPTTREQKERNILDSVFYKGKEWEYEQEARYVKKIKDKENHYDYGWKVEGVYLGCKFLDNSSEELEGLIKLIDLCCAKKIKIFVMNYMYDKNDKKIKLNSSQWIENEHILEIENYSRIKRDILNELVKRLEKSFKGEVLKEFIRKISEKTFDEKSRNELIITRGKLGF